MAGSETIDFSWLAEAVEAGLEERPRAMRSALLGAMWDLADAERFAEIDAALDSVQVENLHDLTITTLMRGPFPFRRALSRWHAFRDRAAIELQKRGHADVLYGIDEPAPQPTTPSDPGRPDGRR